MLPVHLVVAALVALLSPLAFANANAERHADSGPALSLSDALAKAREANPDLAALAQRLRAQDARVQAAGLRPTPELNVQVENLLGTSRTKGFDAAETSIGLSQRIERGGRRGHRLDAARGGRDDAELQGRAGQLEVLAEVQRRFIHVASDQEQLALTELATTLAEKSLSEVQRRVQAAKSPAVELSRARVALMRAHIEHEHAEHELLTSRRQLAAMWNEREPQFGSVFTDLFTLPQPGDFDTLSAKLATSPDLARYGAQARQREAEIRLAQASAQAPLSVSAGVRRLEEGDDTALIAGVSLPLFGGAQARAALAEARAQRDELDAEQTAAQIKAETRLFELVQEQRHAITEAEMLRGEMLPQMQAALDATEYAWQRGRYSYLEWTDAQRERIAVQRALIEAAAHAQLLQVEIERLIGATSPSAAPHHVSGVLP